MDNQDSGLISMKISLNERDFIYLGLLATHTIRFFLDETCIKRDAMKALRKSTTSQSIS